MEGNFNKTSENPWICHWTGLAGKTVEVVFLDRLTQAASLKKRRGWVGGGGDNRDEYFIR